KPMRLMISGSAACPVKLFQQWQELTGQVLLERYGMTEIGMGISNPYNGERRAGYVGQPLPGVEAQLFDEDDQAVNEEGTPGEIRIKGDNLFLEYWDNEQATKESFKDGWFCTGDVAVIEEGYYRIMGRSSVDIIKSGGYKLSALEIEGVLLTHDAIKEVAVIGVADETWGEAVVAIVALNDGSNLEYDDLKQWCDGKMSSYKIPKSIKIVDALPRNAMGKVTKPALKELV
ncbi:MAG: AMP-binding protein, partial [Gammaproteobacteria bacterium]